MNEICPYCGVPQRFQIAWIDSMVTCQFCAKEFLLSRRPRDEMPEPAWRTWLAKNDSVRFLTALIICASFLGAWLVFVILIGL